MEESLQKDVYKGWRKWYPTDEELANFYMDKTTCPIKLLENEYLIICDKEDDELGIYKMQNNSIKQITHASFKAKSESGKIKNINPRNPEQKCAFDMLVDDRTTVKLITGTWGCGKSIALVTAGLQALKEHRFDRIVWIRNNVDVKDTKDMGALPGDANEKLMPFLGPFIDHAGGKQAVPKMIEDGTLCVEPLQFLRGRNLENSLIMCSESENLTKEHLQLILARCAEGSNVWLDGDVRQRDKKAFENSRGLECMIESLKGNELFGHVFLTKVERSKTASLADKII